MSQSVDIEVCWTKFWILIYSNQSIFSSIFCTFRLSLSTITKILLYSLLEVLKLAFTFGWLTYLELLCVWYDDMYFCFIQKTNYPSIHLQMPPLSRSKFPHRRVSVSRLCFVPLIYLSTPVPISPCPNYVFYYHVMVSDKANPHLLHWCLGHSGPLPFDTSLRICVSSFTPSQIKPNKVS